MRIQNSLKNFTSGLGTMVISNVLAFVARTVFIAILDKSYLGVNGLLTNILSMLSLAELGIGTAINFSLYKPIAEEDDNKIALLMNFYKKAYRYIGIVVFLVGLVLMMFLDFIVKDQGEVKNLKLIFLIYLINTSYSYFMTHKVTLLNAYQKSYILAPINIIFNIITTIAQIIILIVTKNYIAYLIINMIVLLIQRLYTNHKITKMYPILNKKTNEKIPKKELDLIVKNVKAMMFHKVGDYCINGTDNIIISSFISISVVGIYSNYLMIINMINGVILMFFNSMTASMGNLISTESDEKKRESFEIINFIGMWLFGFTTVCLYNLLNPFIEIWLGKTFLISQGILAVVILNYYLTGMRVPVATMKMAAGLYDEDKFTPLIQASINLIVSIVLVKKIGLMGVFIGTLVSSLVLPCWQRPYIIYKHIFKVSSKDYFIKYLKYLIIVICMTIGLQQIFSMIFLQVTVVNFIIRVIVCAIVPNIIFILLFNKTKEFKEVLKIVDKISGGSIKCIKRLV
ncbi:MAG: oligosaccharide flippase family protein [Romboutsia sp.]